MKQIAVNVRYFLLFVAGAISFVGIMELMPMGLPRTLVVLFPLFFVAAFSVFFWVKVTKPIKWRWVFSLLMASFLLLVVDFIVAMVFPDYWWVGKLETVKLEHGYSLTLYEDWDVDDLLATLHGPDGTEYQREIIGSAVFRSSPHFTAGNTADGTLGWVTPASNSDEMLFLIDYQSGVVWNSAHWDVLYNGKDVEYLKRINADGGNREFNYGQSIY